MAHSANIISEDTPASQPWRDALLAIRLASVMNANMPGIQPGFMIKASHGPVLDAWLEDAATGFGRGRWRKLPMGLDANGLLGSLDITNTLATGKRQFSQGLLSQVHDGVLLVNSVSSHPPEMLQHVRQTLDQGFVRMERDSASNVSPSSFSLVMIDDAEGDQPAHINAMSDRAMFHLDLTNIDIRSINAPSGSEPVPSQRLAVCGPKETEALVAITVSLGLHSLRPCQHAIQIAIAHATLNGRFVVEDEDIEAAVRLSLINRATAFPQLDETDAEEPHEAERDATNDTKDSDEAGDQKDLTGDIEVEKRLAELPPDILSMLLSNSVRPRNQAVSGAAGSKNVSFDRGKPLSSRKGRPGNGKRLDIVATLRAAAPWQVPRRKSVKRGAVSRVIIHPSDLHIRRYKKPAESTIIFAVDASGSTAINRLGEAKGAVELLLAEGYARRDHVALVSMRGNSADLLLPPTRSLVRAKRCMSQLVGGGGTPLADGLQMAHMLAEEEMRKGRSVSLIVLTDGSANIALDGSGNRKAANEDAMTMAHALSGTRISTLIIDLSKLPSQQAKELASAGNAKYLPMPFASAQNISSAVVNDLAGA